MKTMVEQLAIRGGAPEFADVLHVGRPNIGDQKELFARIQGALDRRWLTNHGPLVQEFESRVAALLGVRHCIAMCNATVALEIVIRALGLTGEVIVPSFTFVASVHSLLWQGITPVFCDVDPVTHMLDVAAAEELITERTTGIMGVHLWGGGCDVTGLTRLAQRHRLRLIFDAAHAFACSIGGRMIGGFGDAEVFSFHATKFLNTFEGGAVTTNDDALAARLRSMANFGFAGYDHVTELGTNGKMNEICAAMGLTGLAALDTLVAHNRRNHAAYVEQLAGVPGVRVIGFPSGQRGNWQYVVLQIDRAAAGIDRDTLMAALHAERVFARRYFYPGCHRMEPYHTMFPEAGARLPVTTELTRTILCLPTGTSIDEETIARVAAIIRLSVAHAAEVTACVEATTVSGVAS
jgi:dTDP-4-amino-4,6-dideoxygalactose transaminase